MADYNEEDSNKMAVNTSFPKSGLSAGVTDGLSMVESAHGDDFLSFMDVATAGQGRPSKGAYGDLLRESELPGM